MKLNELNEDQRLQLKQQILTDKMIDVSYGELMNADTLITDGELESVYGGTEFVPEDFGVEESEIRFTTDEIEVIYNELESRLGDYEGYEDNEGIARVKPILDKIWNAKRLDK